jgi:hypothetical protein
MKSDAAASGWVGLALLAIGGCVCGADLSSKDFVCQTSEDCSPAFACVNGLCATLTSEDAGPGVPVDGGLDAGQAGADAGPPDAGHSDAGIPDAGAGDAGVDGGSSGDVVITSPENGSTVATPFLIQSVCSYDGSNGPIDQQQIWMDGHKYGVVFSTTVDASYGVDAGGHVLTVVCDNYDGGILEQASVSFTVPNDGVYITNPLDGSTVTSSVWIQSICSYSGSNGPINQQQIWMDGHKYGVIFSAAVDASYGVDAGDHVLTVICDNYAGAILEQSSVAFTSE